MHRAQRMHWLHGRSPEKTTAPEENSATNQWLPHTLPEEKNSHQLSTNWQLENHAQNIPETGTQKLHAAQNHFLCCNLESWQLLTAKNCRSRSLTMTMLLDRGREMM
jgi:hypothetical protein